MVLDVCNSPGLQAKTAKAAHGRRGRLLTPGTARWVTGTPLRLGREATRGFFIGPLVPAGPRRVTSGPPIAPSPRCQPGSFTSDTAPLWLPPKAAF